MIQSTIRMTIPPHKSNDALKILRRLVELCRDNPGCVRCHLYRDLQEKNDLVLEEVWRSQEHLDFHIRSEEYRNLLLVLEMSLHQPEIRFAEISAAVGTGATGQVRSRSMGKVDKG